MAPRHSISLAALTALASLAACAAGTVDPAGNQHHKPPPDSFLYDLPQFGDTATKGDGGRRDGSSVDSGRRRDTSRPRADTRHPVPDSKAPKPDAGCVRKYPTVGAAPFTLNFDTNNGGLSGTRDWQWGPLVFKAGSRCSGLEAPPTGGHSGRGVWGTVLDDCYNPLGNEANSSATGCNNVNRNDDSILRLTFEIPSCYSKATLRYWEWTDYYLYFDWAETLLNGKLVRQDCRSAYVKPTAWVQRTVNLTPYIGSKVVFEWHFMASSVVNYSGWYIDDVSVSVVR